MSLRAYGCNTSESDAKVDTAWTRTPISQDSGDRAYAHSTAGATIIQDQEVSLSVPEAFAVLQSLIEQGKTDEIPNNKHILLIS